jgi:GNAT superfamily N-acetyltransferase
VLVGLIDLGEPVWQDGADRIVVVRHAKARMPLKKLATRVGHNANNMWYTKRFDDPSYDFGYGYSAIERADGRDVHVFMYVRRGRVVGVLMAEQGRCFRLVWRPKEPDAATMASQSVSRRWFGNRIWVLPRHRRQGIATRMLEVATRFFGMNVSDFGFRSPFSEKGLQLLRTICHDGVIWVAVPVAEDAEPVRRPPAAHARGRGAASGNEPTRQPPESSGEDACGGGTGRRVKEDSRS